MTSESVPEPPVPDLDLRWPARTVGDGLPLTRLVLIEPHAGELPFQGRAASAATQAIERAPSVMGTS